MKIQPLSALVGAASLGVVLLTVSAFQTPAGKTPAQHLLSTLGLTISGPVQIEGLPTPSQMMRVVEGTPFTVPQGKVFVATGSAHWGSPETGAVVTINGQIVLTPWVSGTPTPIPPGLVATAGQVVEMDDTSAAGTGVLLGYLADA